MYAFESTLFFLIKINCGACGARSAGGAFRRDTGKVIHFFIIFMALKPWLPMSLGPVAVGKRGIFYSDQSCIHCSFLGGIVNWIFFFLIE